MKLVINRSMWLRGASDGVSSLLRRSDNKMCCLGFYAKACGMSDGNIASYSTPDDLPSPLRAHFKSISPWTFKNEGACNSIATLDLIDANDSTSYGLTEHCREDRIAKIFADHGVEVEFVDGDVE